MKYYFEGSVEMQYSLYCSTLTMLTTLDGPECKCTRLKHNDEIFIPFLCICTLIWFIERVRSVRSL